MQVDSFAKQLEPLVSVMMFAMFAHLTLPVEVNIVQTCDRTVIIKMLPLYIINPTHRKIYIHRFLLPPKTFILHWLVEKCRRLNTALQVIKHQVDQIWNWEWFVKEKKRVTTTTHLQTHSPKNHMIIRGTSWWRKVTGSTRAKCQPSRVNEGSFHSPKL